jgi:transposase
MSKVAELAYDIEQLFIEGFSPKSIAAQLNCPLSTVYDWIEGNGCDTLEEDEEFEDPTDYMNLL